MLATEKKILCFISDGTKKSQALRENLEQRAFAVICYEDFCSCCRVILESQPDLVVVAASLDPRIVERMIEDIQSKEPFIAVPPIIMCSIPSDIQKIREEDVKNIFVVDPFSMEALDTCIDVVASARQVNRQKIIRTGDFLYINIDRNIAKIDGLKIQLTPTELRMLYTLAVNPDTVFTREKLLNIIWNGDAYVTDRTVDVHIRSLRKKIRPYASVIATVRGFGYTFKPPVSAS